MRFAITVPLWLFASAASAQTIAALPPVSGLTGGEYVPVVQQGVTKRALVNQFANLVVGPNQVLGNATNATTGVYGLSLPSCSAAGDALIYTLNSGFSCATGYNSGTVTSVATGTGLTGGPVTTTGTISLVAPVTVALGGTNVTSASGTALDNITGFSSTGFLTRTGAGTYAFQSASNGITLGNLAQSAANTMLGNWTGSTTNVAANAMPSCADSGGNHLNYVSGTGITCGTTSSFTGTVTTTGSPASGNLTKFSGATSIVNGDLSGDCTTSGTLAITCLKTNGSSFGTAATQNTGTSGANVPLLNGANTWGASQVINLNAASAPAANVAGQQVVGVDSTAAGFSANTAAAAARFVGLRTDGTIASPSTIAGSGETLLRIDGDGYDSSAYGVGTVIFFQSTQAWTTGHHGSTIIFQTTPNNSTTNTTALTLGQDQSVVANGAYEVTGTQPTLTGTCTTGSKLGGTSAGSFTATCTAQTVIMTFPQQTPNGYVCIAQDITTTTDTLKQSATSTTSCTLSGTTASNDVITFLAMGY